MKKLFFGFTLLIAFSLLNAQKDSSCRPTCTYQLLELCVAVTVGDVVQL